MFASNTSQVSSDATYIEDVFSNFLYTGNGSTQTITNGIDLAGKGGLTWIKKRNAAEDHILTDTVRGAGNTLFSNLTSANEYDITRLSAFTSSGFSVGTSFRVNQSSNTYASWTFRKQPKFFDVVTYTGDGASTKTIPHSLGSTPGFVIIKKINSTGNWMCWHNSFAATDYIALNTTGAKNYAGVLTDIYQGVSSTAVTIGSNGVVNTLGFDYVMYVFAHNAGGFGLTGTDNVISCGSYTGNGSTTGPVINLGYEPQWVMVKRTDDIGNWLMLDTMRGFSQSPDNELYANLSLREGSGLNWATPLATGFQPQDTMGDVNASGGTYIYIAIRRGPMKTPTSGTSVFAPVAQTGGGTVTTNFPVDMTLSASRTGGGGYSLMDRLRGGSANYYNVLNTPSTAAESTGTGAGFGFDNNTGYVDNGFWGASSIDYLNFRRAPGFFDEVCYTGTGADNTQITHNLGVAPELIITKKRSSTGDWWTLCTADADRRVGRVNLTNAFTNSGIASIFGNGTSYVAPTASVFTLGSGSTSTNTSGATYVAYLFASCPGVSKVFNYLGTGSLQTIDCGFASGARLVLIKRSGGVGDWYIWDSSRGISSANDPYLLLNSTAAEVTTTNWVDAAAGGFQVTAASGNNVNIADASYIGIAIA